MTRERALLERFLRAESMAKYALRSALGDVPPDVADFVRRQEAQEVEHQERFERLTGLKARERGNLPRMPAQWSACAVRLLGYEALGFEFARLAAQETSGEIRAMILEILEDETGHVRFYEDAVRRILAPGDPRARDTRVMIDAFLRRLPKTIERYLRGSELEGCAGGILAAVRARFEALTSSGGTAPPRR